jgi:hypothetical protein
MEDKLPTTVADYFRDSPFAKFAGKLTEETGKEDFIALRTHDELRRQTEDSFRDQWVTFRLLVSGIGGGKTWALSWLYRTFSQPSIDDTVVIGVPRLELRGSPERGLVEAIFQALKPDIDSIRTKLRKTKVPAALAHTPTAYVWAAILEPEVYALLAGGGGKLPSLIKDISAPSLTKTEGNIQLLLGLLRVLYAVDYAKVLILIDEVESLFTTYGRKDLFHFSNFLRNIFDEFQTDGGRFLPRLVVLMAGTTYVLERVSPVLVTSQSGASEVEMALQRRMSPPFTLSIRDSEILNIADYRIGKHRKRHLSQPYIPYEKEAILYVWKYSFSNLGDFCKNLQQMYEDALAAQSERITIKHAKKVMAPYVEATAASPKQTEAA